MSLELYIGALRKTVVQAKLNYGIWWIYKSEETRSQYVDVLNRYPLFFQTSLHAHFVALVIALYRLYETRSDTYDFYQLLRLLDREDNCDKGELAKIKARYQLEALPLWRKICPLRNKVVAHLTIEKEVGEVFSQANITYDEIAGLVT